MRAVAQRVSEAAVHVDGAEIARMGPGLLALIGVAVEDAEGDARDLARKLVGLRVFPDESGRMAHSLLETGGSLGLVSQFTLLGDTRKGRRPSYTRAAPGEQAEPLLERLAETIRAEGVPVVCGRFGAHMKVSLVNDGPVTLLLDTRRDP